MAEMIVDVRSRAESGMEGRGVSEPTILGPETEVVLRADLGTPFEGWDVSLLGQNIAGIPLLKRHLISYRRVGLSKVKLVVPQETDEVRRLVGNLGEDTVDVELVSPSECDAVVQGRKRMIHRADTLIDPKFFADLASLPVPENPEGPGEVTSMIVTDRFSENYEPSEKSPYRVGVPFKNEVTVEGVTAEGPSPEGGAYRVGVEVRFPGDGSGETISLALGRYYWHRVDDKEDLETAKKKILLATMKPTDGIYARTNRRVSLAISGILVDTLVTANMATGFTFLFSLASATAFAVGSYPFVVLGAFLSWFASMMDGVDGELARSKFMESDFGCWLEMVCDYLYYVVVFAGIGIGIYRMTENGFWLIAGFGSVFGVLLSFWAVAHQRRLYARTAPASDFGREFQARVGSQKRNPIYRFSRLSGFLATRAALPYFIFFFSVIGLVKVLLLLILFGTNLAWLLLLYAGRLFRV